MVSIDTDCIRDYMGEDDTSVREIPKSEANVPSDEAVGFTATTVSRLNTAHGA